MSTRQPRNSSADTLPQTKIMTAGIKHPSVLTADHCHATGFDGYGKYDLQEQHKLALA